MADSRYSHIFYRPNQKSLLGLPSFKTVDPTQRTSPGLKELLPKTDYTFNKTENTRRPGAYSLGPGPVLREVADVYRHALTPKSRFSGRKASSKRQAIMPPWKSMTQRGLVRL